MPKRRSNACPSRAEERRPTRPAMDLSDRPLASSVRAASSLSPSTKCAGVLPVASTNFAIEAALREARAIRERRHVERLVEMGLHPFDQAGERGIDVGLGLQQRTELRLVARPPRIEHEVPRDQVGGRRTEIRLDQCQRHVDAGRHAGRGPDLAVDDIERLGIDRRAREIFRPAARSSPNAWPPACHRAGPPPPARRRRCRPSRSAVSAAPPCAASARTSSRAITAFRPREPPATSSVS